MRFLQRFFKPFVHHSQVWDHEKEDDMKRLAELPQFRSLIILFERRMDTRIGDMVNGKDVLKNIDEIQDIITQLKNYAN